MALAPCERTAYRRDQGLRVTDASDFSGDPSIAVRAMLDQWLALSNAVAARTLGAGAASEGPPQIGEAIGRVLSAINLPSRAEVLAVGAQVAALDARLARIEALLTANGGGDAEKARSAAPNAAAGRSLATPTRRMTMADLSQIKEHMNLIGADGVHVGTVDHVDGNRIKLTKNDSGDQHHHWISGGLVAGIEGDTVRLSANADVALTFEEDE